MSSQPITYYLSLMSSQYQTAPNQMGWLQDNLQYFQDVMACGESFVSAFSLATAVGPQLDIIGSFVGQSRTVPFQPSNGVSPILDDTTYRTLLQATVLMNHWDGKLGSIRTIWTTLFPSGTLLITDNQNMTVSLYVAAPLTSIMQDLINHGFILRPPQGVLYTFSFASLPLLGFDANTAYEAGFDVGHFT